MTEEHLLIGSLSNDLFRVANCKTSGSDVGAIRFAKEAKRWANPLKNLDVAKHIKNIARDVSSKKVDNVSFSTAEKYLMYGILLQNYALHHINK